MDNIKYIEGVQFYGIVFDGDHQHLYNVLNKNLQRKDVLIIYNENFEDYDDKTKISDDVLRRYRSDYENNGNTENPIRKEHNIQAQVLGIPFGNNDDEFNDDEFSDDEFNDYKKKVNQSIELIIKTIYDLALY